MYKKAPQNPPLRPSKTDLEILIEVEVTSIRIDLLSLSVGSFLICASHDTSLLVIADALLEEIGLAGEGDRLHEVKRIGRIIELLVPESEEKTVSDELNILLHKRSVHAEQRAGEGIRQELLLDGDSLGDDVLDGLLAWAVVEVREEEAGEVRVETLVPGDQLVRKGETGHETALLEPEDGCEGAAEEDAFYGSESDETLGEGGVFVLDPFYCPVGLLTDARN